MSYRKWTHRHFEQGREIPLRLPLRFTTGSFDFAQDDCRWYA